ncbi:hypothetical protein [Microcoleus sp. S13_C3]
MKPAIIPLTHATYIVAAIDKFLGNFNLLAVISCRAFNWDISVY